MASSPGDFTGKQKEELARQHAEEQQRRAGEMSMITAAQEQKKTREVVDYTKPKKAPKAPAGPVDYTANSTAADEEHDPIIDAIVASANENGEDTPESTAPVAPRAEVEPQAPVRVEKTATLIRARYDLPQVTIGHGNTYDFEEGRQYRVPPNAANHLAERGLVDILQ